MTGAKRQKRWRERQRETDVIEIRPIEPLSNAERQRRWRRREQTRKDNVIVGSEGPVKAAMSNAERQRQWRIRQRDLKKATNANSDAGQQGRRHRESSPGEGGIAFRQLLMDGMIVPTGRKDLKSGAEGDGLMSKDPKKTVGEGNRQRRRKNMDDGMASPPPSSTSPALACGPFFGTGLSPFSSCRFGTLAAISLSQPNRTECMYPTNVYCAAHGTDSTGEPSPYARYLGPRGLPYHAPYETSPPPPSWEHNSPTLCPPSDHLLHSR